MTDRINAFTVVLDRDIREDDVAAIQNALQMVRGVRSVSPHVADLQSHIAYERAYSAIYAKVFDALAPDWMKEARKTTGE